MVDDRQRDPVVVPDGAAGSRDSITWSTNSFVTVDPYTYARYELVTDNFPEQMPLLHVRVTRNGRLANSSGLDTTDLTDRWFGFGALDLEKNKLADIKLRTLPSLGAGYHVIKTDQTTFDVFAGLAYNHLDRYTGADFRGMEALIGEESIHKLSPTTTVRQKLVVYPSLKDTGEFRSTFDAGIVTAIANGWNLTATVGHRYDSNPPGKILKNDYIVFTGLQYGWGPK